MARTNRPHEAYRIATLNRWFALSAVCIFVTSVWLIWADYDRSWKDIQRDFRAFERQRLSYKQLQAQNNIDVEKLKNLRAQASEANEALMAKRERVMTKREAIKTLKNNLYHVAKQQYNFERAKMGDHRYQTEHALTPELLGFKCHYYRVEGGPRPEGCKEGQSLRDRFLDQEDALNRLQTELDAMLAEQKAAESALTAVRRDVNAAQKAHGLIESNFFTDVIRDAPILDFLVPSLKIKQVVIKDIRDDYNFATVQKEDRCMTCHLGIDSREHSIDPNSHRFVQPAARHAMESDLIVLLNQFIDAQGQEAPGLREELYTYLDDAAMTLDGWLEENSDNQDAVAAFKITAIQELEKIRARTQLYKAHPDLDLYMSSASPHPIKDFGCSVCHEGRGQATDFGRVFHEPKNQEQKQAWRKQYDWHEAHSWDYPQLPSGRVTASCAKCHNEEPKLTGGGAYERGRRIVENRGCFGCHRIEGMTGVLRKRGPSLTRVASKIDRAFAYSWVWAPKHFRPSTKMPAFFSQTNNRGPDTLARTEQEVRGIVAYLYRNSEAYVPPQQVDTGDVAQGKRLFETVGCLGCHSMTIEGQEVNNHGPDLSAIGNKLSAQWVYHWIKNPKSYWPGTAMPSLRLSAKEASDIVAYLMSKKTEGWQPLPQPAANAAVQRQLLREALNTSMRRDEIKQTLDDLNAEDREIMLGQKTIAKYGCFGCHDIKGFEKSGPIGTELSRWGEKFIAQLDFGLISHHGKNAEVDFSRIGWATEKLNNPRFWDRGKERTKSFQELLKMPNFGFTQGEIHSVVTFLLSRRNQHVHIRKRPAKTETYLAVQAGRRLVRELNCHGCHYFDDEGGDLARYWYIDSVGIPIFQSAKAKSDFSFVRNIPGPTRGHVPPVLLDQGNKTKPRWLFDFLHNPTTLRPQIKMRMPTFGLDDHQANALVRMFAGLEHRSVGDHSTFAPNAQLASMGEKLFKAGQCERCHMFANRDPKVVPESILAPNLKLASIRLQPSWTPRWLADPQSIMPGANMPNYFDLQAKYTALDPDNTLLKGDLALGMEAINHYLMMSGRSYVTPTSQAR